ncbi:MAG: UvrD-helicase domain-containing protein [Candidatus Doudnabacteria bacterium]|nr:UvrD-helicase domain-containing protein [Candidatus Doudnabacteria bacterium]
MKQEFTHELGLNPEQLKAVTAPLGPVLILAGAGSGKTRALTMRIVYLIKKLKIDPMNILAVTFTNKAAGEMKGRISKLLSNPGKISNIKYQISNLPAMGTFHSIGAKILRAEARLIGRTPNFVIYDDEDSENLIKEILLRERIDPTKFKPSLFGSLIDRAKNNLIEPRDYNDNNSDDRFNSMVRTVYAAYEQSLVQNNAVDFGDLIMLPVKLFREKSQILSKYQNLWKYILVDEYQDTNHAQYILTKLLASRYKNIFVVGDDAQAIYGFRGADLQNILDFEDDYPEAQVVRLEQNYRSTKPILSVAEKVIELSVHQHKKRLWTEAKGGVAPVVYTAEDEMAEAWFVGRKIIDLQDTGSLEEFSYELEDQDESILSRIMRHSQARVLPKLKNKKGLNNIAVLYRTHFQSRALEEVLISAAIPYQIVGGLKFYERKEIKDILSYLRLIINPRDLVSLKRVINVPPRGIGPATFGLIKDAMLNSIQHLNNKDPELNSGLRNLKPQVENFFKILQTLSNLPEEANILDVLRNLLKLTGYENYLKDGSDEGESRWENVQELFNVAAVFQNLTWKEGLSRFLEEIALMTGVDELDSQAEKVTLMTLHQAKGLEFDTVFLIGLEEGLLPHARSILDPRQIAEEIRLAYVGITRAKKHLYLVHAQSRRQFGLRNLSVPSRILKAIPEELLERYEPEF